MKAKIYGYCRVSTKQQNIERQIRNIKDMYPDAIIVTDEFTGTKLDRPGWTKLYKQLNRGTTVVFDSVSRMSRNAKEGFDVYKELYERGIRLIFLKEHHIDTDAYENAKQGIIKTTVDCGDSATDELVNSIMSAINKFMMNKVEQDIYAAFEQAQIENDTRRQNTKEGIETARLNGKQIGQPKGAKLTTKKSIKAKEIIRKHSKDFEGTLSDVDVMKLIGCARGSYYKWKRELRALDSVTDEDSGEKKIEVDLERLPSEDTVIKSGVLVDYHLVDYHYEE